MFKTNILAMGTVASAVRMDGGYLDAHPMEGGDAKQVMRKRGELNKEFEKKHLLVAPANDANVNKMLQLLLDEDLATVADTMKFYGVVYLDREASIKQEIEDNQYVSICEHII